MVNSEELKFITYTGLIAWVGTVFTYLLGEVLLRHKPEKVSPYSIQQEEKSLQRLQKVIVVVQVFIFVDIFICMLRFLVTGRIPVQSAWFIVCGFIPGYFCLLALERMFGIRLGRAKGQLEP